MANIFDKNSFWAGAVQLDQDVLAQVQCCLVMVPHPDDESLACAGLIATLINQGKQVHIILTTDGSKSHPGSKEFPPSRLAGVRLSELKGALGLLGVAEENLTYYSAEDASMPTKGSDGFPRLVSKLSADLTAVRPDLILVPYEADPHCDHRATHQLLISALEKAGISRPRIWEYPIWLYEYAELSDVPELESGELLSLDISKYLELKKQCIYAHQSQTTHLIGDDPEGFILLPEVIANFTQGKEYFMERKKINPSGTLPQKYFENMYRENNDPWNFEKSEYEKEKYKATLAAIPAGNYQRALEIGCSIGVLTQMLTERCVHLLAMDISGTALDLARKRLEGSTAVEFLAGGIPQDFPPGNFDLIVMSEVGYYLSMEDLLTARQQIFNALTSGGVLILVHWTHFVADYPLSGDEVHDCFNGTGMPHIYVQRKEDYRLDVYRKP